MAVYSAELGYSVCPNARNATASMISVLDDFVSSPFSTACLVLRENVSGIQAAIHDELHCVTVGWITCSGS